jgi:ATP synthase protein I
MENNENLDMISSRIKQLREKINQNIEEKNIKKSEINYIIVGVDLVSATIIGLIIGLYLDRIFNSKPIFLIICLIIGMIAGMKMIIEKINIKIK